MIVACKITPNMVQSEQVLTLEGVRMYAAETVTDIQEYVLAELQTGRSLRQVCKDEGMPDIKTIGRWLIADAAFAHKYARARTAQADVLFDRMEAVEEAVSAGTMDSHAARVVLDSMRWRASKLAPKVYGDRLDVQVTDNRISIAGALQAAQTRLADVIDVTPRLTASCEITDEGGVRSDDKGQAVADTP